MTCRYVAPELLVSDPSMMRAHPTAADVYVEVGAGAGVVIIAHELTHSLTHSLTDLLTHSLIHSLTHSSRYSFGVLLW